MQDASSGYRASLSQGNHAQRGTHVRGRETAALTP
jgi:hypothetical protein